MSSRSSSSGQWPPRRPSKRSKLRNGTFIDPGTGERSRRQFTLRNPPPSRTDGPDDDVDAATPLLSRGGVTERIQLAAHSSRASMLRFWKWLDSSKGRGVLKCTLAYMIASLWTFWPPLSDVLGHLDGKHVVATITVYFHPARTAGSMIEAGAIASLAVIYAEVVSVLSMATSVFFGSVLDWATLAYTVVLVVFVGGAFGFLGWVKQKLNNPSVNVGCTLASLAIIAVVTKENAIYSSVFSNLKIVQVLKMLIFGILTTSAVNLLVWRVSARTLLRQSMSKSSTALGNMLSMITHGFLSGSEEELASPEFRAASSAWSSGYSDMTKNLRESKYEHYFLGHEKIYQLDKMVYKSMETLAQSIGGLRSAANTQFALLKEPMTSPLSGSVSPGTATFFPHTLSRSLSHMLKSGKDRVAVLSAIDEVPNESADDDDETGDNAESRGEDPAAATSVFRAPSDIFELFITLLGPSMKSLAFTLSGVLREPPFGAPPSYEITINDHFRQSLTDALGLFNNARADALQELYKHIELGRQRSEKIQADFEEVAAACGHFSFSLQTFGEEMTKYLDVLDDLKYESEHNRRSWRWAAFWKTSHAHSRALPVLPFEDPERESLVRPIRKSQLPKGIPDTLVERRDTFAWQAAPQANRVIRTAAQELLRFSRFLTRDDIRFGLKVGIGAALWAMFAFISETRHIYMHWRGEWGLLSFMIVCSMTVGASNTTGLSRFLGTVVGATCAVINWNVSQGAAVPLVFLGGIVAFWSFYVMIDRGKAPLGRTTLLAYNVSSLYAYSLSQRVDDDDDDEGGVHPFIMEIATHRAIAVTAGILWGLVVCRVIWPISARKKFKEGLSVLLLQMGLIWKRGPLAILLRSDCSRSYLKSGEQAALQRYASRLDTLRASAVSEFELRGPFPFAAAGSILASTNRVLDAFYAMSLVTQRHGHLSDGEKALLLFTSQERAQLCDRICHVFQVLASSIMLEYPLTDAVPSVVGVRDILLGKIFQFRKDHTAAAATAAVVAATAAATPDAAKAAQADGAGSSKLVATTPHAVGDVGGDGGGGGSSRERGDGEARGAAVGHASMAGQVAMEEGDYALLYAYALVTGQVAEELKVMEKEIEGLFGVLDEELMLLQ